MSSINDDDIRDVERSRYRMLLSLLHMMNGPPQTETMEQVLNRLFQSSETRLKRTCDNFIEELETIEITTENESCSICLETFKEGDKVIKLPCDDKPHYFHTGDNQEVCGGILPWLQINNTCPVCRTEFPYKEEDHTEESVNNQEEDQEQSNPEVLNLPFINIIVQPLLDQNHPINININNDDDIDDESDNDNDENNEIVDYGLQAAIYESMRPPQ